MGGIPNSDSGHRQVSDELRDAIGISVQCSLMLSLLATMLSTLMLSQLNVRVLDHEFLTFMSEFGWLG